MWRDRGVPTTSNPPVPVNFGGSSESVRVIHVVGKGWVNIQPTGASDFGKMRVCEVDIPLTGDFGIMYSDVDFQS